MIRFKDKVYEDYFIDEHTGVITDINGNIKHQIYRNGYMIIKIKYDVLPVHQVQAHTKWGYKGDDYHVHHVDDNSLNNDIDNLKYITKSEHMRITHLGQIPWNKGKKLPIEQVIKTALTRRLHEKQKRALASDNI